MNALSQLLQTLEGRRTYILAGAITLYLVLCQFLGHKPDETILGVLGAASLASLRAGFNSPAPREPEAPVKNPTTSGPGTGLKVLLAIGCLVVLGPIGCATRTKDLTTSHIRFRMGTNEAQIIQPKDSAWKKLQWNEHGITIEGYVSAANAGAMQLEEIRARSASDMLMQGIQLGRDGAETYLRMQGFPVPPRQYPAAPPVQAPVPIAAQGSSTFTGVPAINTATILPTAAQSSPPVTGVPAIGTSLPILQTVVAPPATNAPPVTK